MGLAAATCGGRGFRRVQPEVSQGRFNVRLDLSYGPSLLGRGLTGAFDLYLRF